MSRLEDDFDSPIVPQDLGYGSYQARRQSKKDKLNLWEIILSALVFLTVVAWVEYLFAHIKRSGESDDDDSKLVPLRPKVNRFWYSFVLTIVTLVSIGLYYFF